MKKYFDYEQLLDDGIKTAYWAKVVRCRDCEYIDSWEFAEGKIRYVCTHFDYTDIIPDGFCAWGERRES